MYIIPKDLESILTFEEFVNLSGIPLGTEITSKEQITSLQNHFDMFYREADGVIFSDISAYAQEGKTLILELYTEFFTLHRKIFLEGNNPSETLTKAFTTLEQKYTAALHHLAAGHGRDVSLVERYAFAQLLGDFRTFSWGFLGAGSLVVHHSWAGIFSLNDLTAPTLSPITETALAQAQTFAQDFLDSYVGALVTHAQNNGIDLENLQHILDADAPYKKIIHLFGVDHFKNGPLDQEVQPLMSIRQWKSDRGQAYHDVSADIRKTYGERRGERFSKSYRAFFEQPILAYKHAMAQALVEQISQLSQCKPITYLDIGTGQLALPLLIAGNVPSNTRIYVLEISPWMLEECFNRKKDSVAETIVYFDDAAKLRSLHPIGPDVISQSLIYHSIGPGAFEDAKKKLLNYVNTKREKLFVADGDVIDKCYEAHMIALPDNGFELEAPRVIPKGKTYGVYGFRTFHIVPT